MARRRQQTVEEQILLTVVLCLFAAGAVMVFSASSARSVLSGDGDGTSYLVQYVTRGGIGLLALFAVARISLGRIPKLTGPFLGLALGLVCVTPFVGIEVNGSKRWLGAGPLQFQPSELLKLALLLYAVKLLAERPRRTQRPKELLPLALLGGFAIAITAYEDLGTALVMAMALMCILLAAGVPMRVLAGVAGAGTVLVTLFSLTAEYRRERLLTFLDPWNSAGDAGFQAVQGQIALGSGGIFGTGLGQSQAKNMFLPEAHTDFILAIVGEELGVAGVAALLFLYGLLAYAGLQIAKRARGNYAKLLAAGITALVLCQATLNVFTVLGLAPLTGVPLPFISYGPTNLIVLLAGLGLLLNIARGGHAHLRVVTPSAARGTDDRHRGRRDGRSRGAGARGGRRAAG